MSHSPELLLPAGNPEAFFAALQAGAGAVYLGLEQFNARGRATNFNSRQLPAILREARKKNVKVYITLNTVVKNTELAKLLEVLAFLSEAQPDAVIVQDWGVFYLARNFFPRLVVHASTQMGIHNSQGTQYLAGLGFARTVLARELTLKELVMVVKNSPSETEVFVHGALCYSFSGMCLFSSYTGGRGANRGICSQSCRRTYDDAGKQKFLFNMKDNQLLDLIPQLAAMGVASLKVEGRMKPAEYVFRVGSAYRMVLNDSRRMDEAKQLLALDFGRQKTRWFAGGDVKEAVADDSSTGIFVGKVEGVANDSVVISSSLPIENRYRLRLMNTGSGEPAHLVVKKVTREGAFYRVNRDNLPVSAGSRVYLTKLQDIQFPNKLEETRQMPLPLDAKLKKTILEKIQPVKKERGGEQLYFRIGSAEWLKLISFAELDGLFLSFSKQSWMRFNPADEFIQQNLDKVIVELPRFIAEKSLGFYAELVEKMVQHGIRSFVVSHLSQKLMIPAGCRIFASENVYVFNDAAARFLENEGVENFVYPFESDFETLDSMQHKNGIVPMYFFPELFFSRMPVQLENEASFSGDDTKSRYRRFRKNGLTVVVPDKAVSILQHKNRLTAKGFSSFLIDVTWDTLSKNRLKTLKTRFLKSEQLQPTTSFNFTKGLV
ncbi:MAG: peptidase U32 family protein [Draconibacterium sp.]